MADYGPDIDRVVKRHNNLPVYLKLRTRDDVCPEPFYVLSWRTNNVSGQNNRYSYFDKKYRTGFWKIPVSVALEALACAEEKGMLDAEFDDLQIRHGGVVNITTDSRSNDLSERTRENALASVVDESEDWGAKPIFIIIEVPDGKWRKTLILDSDREFCTFRSTTRDHCYRRKSYRARLASPWILDNAMPDASAAMMRQFLQVLRQL